VDDGTTTYRADLRYWGLANAAMTYNPDGTMASVTKAGRTTTFTYTDGVLTHADPRPTSQTGSRRRAVPLLRSGEPVR
jgi:hypothetical protein